MNNSLGLVKRFNKREQELAAKISNDIAENIDCHETRKELRMAVAFLADVVAVQGQEISSLKMQILTEKLKRFMY